MMASSSSQDQNEFVHGAIKEIKLANFLIYDSAAVKPGPHLNVIIGPNATGKSTVVNAICLGLAGKVSILGRAKEITSFIKNGCNKAIIEIELYNSRGKNPHIKRIIHRNGTPNTNWFIDGKSAQLKQVEELVASYNIQVSNLCQFLPQDRVSDFVKMTNIELLHNTQLAADKSLYDTHCRLKDAQKRSNDLHTDFSKLTEQLEREKKLNAALERDVENLKEKEGYEMKVKHLNEKRPWVEYEEYRQLHITQKAERDALEKRRDEVLAENAPAQNTIDRLKRTLNENTSKYRDIGQKILIASREVVAISESMQTYTERVDEVESILKSKEAQEKTRLKRVKDFTTQVDDLEARLANMGVTINLEPEIAEAGRSVQNLNSQRYELDEEIRALTSEKESKKHEIIAIESELKRIRDVDSQKLNIVKNVARDTYEAIRWLRANQSQFEDVIYEPPLMTLNVRERSNAKYVESCIGFNDMKTFICTKAADHEKFYHKVREENGLIINAAVALNSSPQQYQPSHPVTKYSKYGFRCYLKDMVEAPDPVLAYLCHLSQLHTIPVGDRRVNNFVEQIPDRCPDIKRYLSDSHSYSYKRSKYGDRSVLTRSTDLKPASLLIHSADESRVAELTSNLKVLKDEENELTKKVQELTLKLSDVNKKMEEAKQLKKDLIKKQGEKKALQEKLKLKKASLAQLQKDDVIDLKQERLKCKQECAKIYAEKIGTFSRQAEKTKVVMARCRERCKLGLENFAISEEIKLVEQSMSENNLMLVGLENELVEKKNQMAKTRDIAKRLQKEAQRVVGDPSSLSKAKQQIFNKLPSSLEGIDAAIADLQARIDLIFVDSDRAVVEEYDNRRNTIERMEARLAGREASQTAQRDEISQLKESWLPPLNAIIKTINKQFARYFTQIRCAGEITLKVPPNPNDFDNYGIAINVKYGDNKPMKELTTFQSGGERSVATVLYMLSLQELSSSPFRCVDEINQGMDEQNERRVFELVVQTACKPTSPQYFLLTPKLLPDLLYSDRMTVHIVHNGPYMIDYKSWDVDKFIGRREEFAD